MKKLILCEGSYDKIFLMSLFSKFHIPDQKIDVFEQSRAKKKSGLRVDETAKLRNFFSSNYDILVKSETGKGKVTLLFPEILAQLYEKGYLEYVKIFSIVDLDVKIKSNKAINEKYKKILNKIKHNLKDLNNIISVDVEKLPNTSGIVITYLIRFRDKKTNSQIGNPSYLICFIHSLEYEANKIPSNKGIKDKISKLSELPEIQKAFEFFKS